MLARRMTEKARWIAQPLSPAVKWSSTRLERYLRSPESLINRISEVDGINEQENLTIEFRSLSGTLCRFTDSIHG